MRLFGSTSVTEAEFIHEQNQSLSDRLRFWMEKADRYHLELERERERSKHLEMALVYEREESRAPGETVLSKAWPDARVYQDETTPTWWPRLHCLELEREREKNRAARLHQDSVLPRDGWDQEPPKPPRSKWDRTQIAMNVGIVVGVTVYVVGTIVVLLDNVLH